MDFPTNWKRVQMYHRYRLQTLNLLTLGLEMLKPTFVKYLPDCRMLNARFISSIKVNVMRSLSIPPPSPSQHQWVLISITIQ